MSTIASAPTCDQIALTVRPVELVIPGYQVDLLREVVGKASSGNVDHAEQLHAAFELVGIVRHLLDTRLP